MPVTAEGSVIQFDRDFQAGNEVIPAGTVIWCGGEIGGGGSQRQAGCLNGGTWDELCRGERNLPSTQPPSWLQAA